MGDSSVSCVLTGISMTYSPAVLIALAPARFCHISRKHPTFEPGARVISNEGAHALFTPVLLPIFGKMDSYGHLTNIETDEHTKYLEARLGESIQRIADAIVDGERLPAMEKFARRYKAQQTGPYKKNTTWDGTLYGCFVHRTAWDEFSTSTVSEFGKPDYSVWDDSWSSPHVLKNCGFVAGKRTDSQARLLLGTVDGDRFHTPFTHPKLPGVVVWSDMHMAVRVTFDGVPVRDSVVRPSALQEQLVARGMSLSPAAIKWAKTTPAIKCDVVAARREHNKALRRARKETQRYAELPGLEMAFRRVADTAPAEVQERNEAIIRRRTSAFMDSFLTRMAAAYEAEVAAEAGTTAEAADPRQLSLLPEPKEEEANLPAGTTQTFCDGHMHVVLTAVTDNTPGEPCVGPCTKTENCKAAREYRNKVIGENLSFPASVRDALYANGWKPKRVRPDESQLVRDFTRAFASEFQLVYRSQWLRAFGDQTAQLVTFGRNLVAANKLYQPTATGYQYGHFYMQRRVAQMTAKLAKAHIDEQEKWR